MSKANPLDALDLSDVLYEEARQLQARAVGSARMVGWVILAGAVLLAVLGHGSDALIWTGLAGTMALATLVYAHIFWSQPVQPSDTAAYLKGHVVVSACTGLVWGGFAIYQVQGGGEAQIFVAAVFLSSITTGGAMSGTVYRPGYLALATASLIPFGLYLSLFTKGHLQVFGLFVFLYYAFCYITNEQASRRTRQAILSDLGHAAAQEILEQTKTIERLNAEKQRFTAAISHDMTQPIIAQQHLLATLERQADLAPHGATLRGIRQALDSQKMLLDDLVSYSQLDTLAATISFEHISVPELIDALCLEFRARAQARGVRISARVDCAEVNSSRHVLLRILRNLLSNAIKYAIAEGEVLVTVTPVAEADGVKGVRFEICNDGPTIPAAEQARIFEEYVRLPDGRSQPGLGLGLTITRSLVSELGGTIDLVSQQGRTCFSVMLPDHAIDAPRDADITPFVLLVGHENDPYLGSYSEMMSLWMWRFAHAETAEAAQQLIELLGSRPDVTLLDPLEANLDMTEQASNLRRNLGAPVLQVARGAKTGTVEGAAQLKAPFSPRQLRAEIEALLVD